MDISSLFFGKKKESLERIFPQNIKILKTFLFQSMELEG
jgi:hypothetical protein